MAGRGAWRRRAAVTVALLLGVAGVGCGRERQETAGGPPAPPEGKVEVRREFVVLRELAKQREVQGGASNEARVEAVERYLGEWLERVPDEGANEEEREILRRAREIAGP